MLDYVRSPSRIPYRAGDAPNMRAFIRKDWSILYSHPCVQISRLSRKPGTCACVTRLALHADGDRAPVPNPKFFANVGPYRRGGKFVLPKMGEH